MENISKRGSLVFEEFRLDAEAQILLRGNEKIHLAKRPFCVLLHLLENRERIVSRDELLETFWNGRDVYDDALRKAVGAIRKSLDDTQKTPRFIETRWGGGYRFIGNVEELQSDKIASPSTGFPIIENKNAPDTKEFVTSSLPKNKPRYVLAIIALALISLASLGFFAYRQQSKNVSAKPESLLKAAASRRSIAVLPLKNLTGDVANDYLSDGITESLINELARIEGLKVISRSSVFQYKNKEVTPQEVGAKLNVEAILEGGLKQNGDKLRVETRLVSTKDGSVLWAGDFQEKQISDLFVIQDGIVCQIVSELRVKLCGEVAPSSRYTKNFKAYQLYLRGLYYRNLITNENLQKAIGFYDEALRVAPDYALAHEGLAIVNMVLEFNSAVPPGTAAPKAEFHAQKALELDDSLAGAYIVLGAVKTMKNYDLKTRENYYQQALLRNPNHRTARLWLANNYTVQGKFEEAEREILRAQELDPLSFGVRLHLSELYYYWRKPDKTIEQAELMLAANPDNKGTYSFLAKAYAQKGEFDKAFAAVKQLSSDDSTRAFVLAAAGRKDEARKIAETFANSDDTEKNPYYVACLYAISGDKETAFVWLEKSYAVRQADLVSIKIDPALDSLHDDERYKNLLERVGLKLQ